MSGHSDSLADSELSTSDPESLDPDETLASPQDKRLPTTPPAGYKPKPSARDLSRGNSAQFRAIRPKDWGRNDTEPCGGADYQHNTLYEPEDTSPVSRRPLFTAFHLGWQPPVHPGLKSMGDGLSEPRMVLLGKATRGDKSQLEALEILHAVHTDPCFREPVLKAFRPYWPFMLLPRLIRDQVAIYLIFAGHTAITKVCKTLAAQTKDLIRHYGVYRMAIGAPRYVDRPPIVEPDTASNIMNVQIHLLRINNFGTRGTDINTGLLGQFSRSPPTRNRCELTIVGMPGQTFAMSEEFLKDMMAFLCFKEVIFNLRCIHPGQEPHSASFDWRNNTWNCSYNDLLIGAKMLGPTLGPWIILHRGVIFQPHTFTHKRQIEQWNKQSGYSNPQHCFHWLPQLSHPEKRIMFRPRYDDYSTLPPFAQSENPNSRPYTAIQAQVGNATTSLPIEASSAFQLAMAANASAPRQASILHSPPSTPPITTAPVTQSLFNLSVRPPPSRIATAGPLQRLPPVPRREQPNTSRSKPSTEARKRKRDLSLPENKHGSQTNSVTLDNDGERNKHLPHRMNQRRRETYTQEPSEEAAVAATTLASMAAASDSTAATLSSSRQPTFPQERIGGVRPGKNVHGNSGA